MQEMWLCSVEVNRVKNAGQKSRNVVFPKAKSKLSSPRRAFKSLVRVPILLKFPINPHWINQFYNRKFELQMLMSLSFVFSVHYVIQSTRNIASLLGNFRLHSWLPYVCFCSVFFLLL
ncbi:hypothetical protein XENORESO_012815 [Xenotaenia resolanae]|uniref:Uncharacterized protein n=1 Tax=Xenotaenia resolanae TaxID=208358 RepID=A0ABV0WH43_9TELE